MLVVWIAAFGWCLSISVAEFGGSYCLHPSLISPTKHPKQMHTVVEVCHLCNTQASFADLEMPFGDDTMRPNNRGSLFLTSRIGEAGECLVEVPWFGLIQREPSILGFPWYPYFDISFFQITPPIKNDRVADCNVRLGNVIWQPFERRTQLRVFHWSV